MFLHLENVTLPWSGKMMDQQYHGSDIAKQFLSSTMLKELAKSPAHLRYMLDADTAHDTPALILGRAIHCMALEGEEEFNKHFGEKKLSWATKEGKKEKERFNSLGLTALSGDDMATVKGFTDAFNHHEAVCQLVVDGENPKFEETVLWVDEESGLGCRAKIDLCDSGVILVIDLKSTQNADPEVFIRGDFWKYKYHLQAAHYAAGWMAATKSTIPPDFYFYAGEKTPPYCSKVFKVSDRVIAYAMKERRKLINVYKECLTENEWPGYEESIYTIHLPTWIERRDGNDI